MCGVIGFACNKPTKSLYEFVTNAMVETEVRGPHATGYAYLDNQGKVRYKKAPVKASEYVNTRAWTSLKNNMPKRLLGHCRYTTTGSQDNNKNNHPHVGHRYALIHNGTIKGYEYRPWTELCRTECDSEAILRVMELGQSVVKATSRAFNCFYDSNFSVLLLDKKTKDMHFFRNPARPLRVWRGDSFIVIGSTENILESAFEKTFGISSKEVKGLEKWTPTSGTLYSVNKKMEIKKTELFDYAPEVKPTNSLPAKVQQYSHYSGGTQYNLGSKGHGKPNRKAYVDGNGNIVYDFDND